MLLITDIDDVISDALWRRELLPEWDAYHAAAINDRPHRHIIALINALHANGVQIIAITGRPEKWRQLTNDWLLANQVRIDSLLMRSNDNFMTSPDLKLSMMRELEAGEVLILEDRDDVVTALRGAGYNVLQVFNQRAS